MDVKDLDYNLKKFGNDLSKWYSGKYSKTGVAKARKLAVLGVIIGGVSLPMVVGAGALSLVSFGGMLFYVGGITLATTALPLVYYTAKGIILKTTNLIAGIIGDIKEIIDEKSPKKQAEKKRQQEQKAKEEERKRQAEIERKKQEEQLKKLQRQKELQDEIDFQIEFLKPKRNIENETNYINELRKPIKEESEKTPIFVNPFLEEEKDDKKLKEIIEKEIITEEKPIKKEETIEEDEDTQILINPNNPEAIKKANQQIKKQPTVKIKKATVKAKKVTRERKEELEKLKIVKEELEKQANNKEINKNAPKR